MIYVVKQLFNAFLINKLSNELLCVSQIIFLFEKIIVNDTYASKKLTFYTI